MNKRIGKDSIPEGEEEYTLEGDFEDVSGLEGDLDEQIAAIFADIGDSNESVEYSIKVYRSQPGKGKLGYLFSCLSHELPILDRLRDDYGGGDFEVRVLRNNRIFRRRTVCVEAPLKKEPRPFDGSEKLNGMVEVMANGFTRLGELIVQRDQLLPQQNTSMKDMLEMMMMMKEMNGPPPEVVSPFQQIKDVLSIQKSLAGKEGGSETNVNDVLLTLAENVLPKLAEAATASTDVPNQQTLSPENADKTPGIDNTPDIVKTTTPEKGNPMKGHLMFLCMQASLKKNPALYAEVVLDNTPDDKLDELVSAIKGEGAIDGLINIHPPVANHKAWFLELSKEILNNVEEVEQIPENEALQNAAEPPKNSMNVSEKTDNGDTVPDT